MPSEPGRAPLIPHHQEATSEQRLPPLSSPFSSPVSPQQPSSPAVRRGVLIRPRQAQHNTTKMPMFREDDEGQEKSSGPADSHYPDSAPIPIQTPPGLERWLTPRRLSEESIRTDLCEGLVPESPPVPATPERPVTHLVSDRAELIERLKRGESPTWISNRRVSRQPHCIPRGRFPGRHDSLTHMSSWNLCSTRPRPPLRPVRLSQRRARLRPACCLPP